MKKRELKMKIECQVATSQKLIDMLKKKMRILHISCHGIKDSGGVVSSDNKQANKNIARPKMGLAISADNPELESNFLVLETPTGEGELVDAL